MSNDDELKWEQIYDDLALAMIFFLWNIAEGNGTESQDEWLILNSNIKDFYQNGNDMN